MNDDAERDLKSIFTDHNIHYDRRVIDRLSRNWKRTAGVHKDQHLLSNEKRLFDPNIPDFFEGFIPIRRHHAYLAMSVESKQEILTCAWISMNTRIVAIEEGIVEPALDVIANPHVPGAEAIHVLAQQTMEDEIYHSALHRAATAYTRTGRGYDRLWDIPTPVTVLRLEELKVQFSEPWQQQLVYIAFAVIAEVSFNSFLTDLANTEIQPYNQEILRVHARDEARHGQTLAECCKALYVALSDSQKVFFISLIVPAINAFLEEDWNGWRAILSHVGLPNSQLIVDDIRSHDAADPDLIALEYRPIKKLLDEMGVTDNVPFDFSRFTPIAPGE